MDKSEKPKRVLTKEEELLRAKRNSLFESIQKMKNQRAELKAKQTLEFDLYYKQLEDIAKIKFMMSLQRKLKNDESERKRLADQQKIKDEEVERKNLKVYSKFSDEIELCDYLTGIMHQIKIKEYIDSSTLSNIPNAEYKVNDALLKEENLVLVKNKKNQFEGVQPGQRKKSNKKHADTSKVTCQSKFTIDAVTAQNLTKLGLTLPISLQHVDATINELKTKKENYLVLREEAIKAAKDTANTEIDASAETVTNNSVNQTAQNTVEQIKFDEHYFPSL
jgi:hypothetical protein